MFLKDQNGRQGSGGFIMAELDQEHMFIQEKELARIQQMVEQWQESNTYQEERVDDTSA